MGQEQLVRQTAEKRTITPKSRRVWYVEPSVNVIITNYESFPASELPAIVPGTEPDLVEK